MRTSVRIMERAVLEDWIGDGLSLDEMGRRAGRHPSTVSYWMRKHGLAAVGAERHRARGRLDRDELAVPHRCRAVGPRHRGGDRPKHRRPFVTGSVSTGWRPLPRRARLASDAGRRRDLEPTCRSPRTDHLPPARIRRRRTDACGVVRAGHRAPASPACRRSSSRRPAAGAPSAAITGTSARSTSTTSTRPTKRFAIARSGATRSLDAQPPRSAKCVLLCSNCHAEVEAGLKLLP